jgi:hypothetical protein
MATIETRTGLDEREASRRRMESALRDLNDVLSAGPMAGRTWLFSGVLLGFAREGAILLHDTDDADLAFLAEDTDVLESCFPSLIAAGFVPHFRFPGVVGPATEYSFTRNGAKFEFFRVEVRGDRFCYANYGYSRFDDRPVMNHCSTPAQPLEEIHFLERSWLKPQDHDLELTAMYGDWRTPDASFNYLTGPAVDRTEPWDDSTFSLWETLYTPPS